MSENYSFFNSKDHDRKYNARHWADYFKPLFVSGVFNGDLNVTANNDMTVTLNAGYAWLEGYGYHLDAPLTFNMETASGNMNRIDNIIIRLDLTNRYVKAFAVTGTYYSGKAVAPALERTATIYEVCVCQINMAAGTTAITQAMITDTRMNSDLCGWVTGSVEQISFEQITAQFNTFFAQYEADIQTEYAAYLQNIGSLETQAQTSYDTMNAEFTAYEAAQKTSFEAWVASIKDILDGNVAGNLLLLIEQKMQKATTTTVNGKLTLEIEDGLNMAISGFTAKDTQFGADKKTVTETDGSGNIKTTTFVSKTQITEEYQFTSGKRYTKTTTFNGNDITERIVENE